MHDEKYMVPLSKEQTGEDMVRQCAWCLRLIDAQGGRVTVRPQPKLYEATHGMCIPCGEGWMEQVAEAQGVHVHELWAELPLSLLAQKQSFENALSECVNP